MKNILAFSFLLLVSNFAIAATEFKLPDGKGYCFVYKGDKLISKKVCNTKDFQAGKYPNGYKVYEQGEIIKVNGKPGTSYQRDVKGMLYYMEDEIGCFKANGSDISVCHSWERD